MVEIYSFSIYRVIPALFFYLLYVGAIVLAVLKHRNLLRFWKHECNSAGKAFILAVIAMVSILAFSIFGKTLDALAIYSNINNKNAIRLETEIKVTYYSNIDMKVRLNDRSITLNRLDACGRPSSILVDLPEDIIASVEMVKFKNKDCLTSVKISEEDYRVLQNTPSNSCKDYTRFLWLKICS